MKDVGVFFYSWSCHDLKLWVTKKTKNPVDDYDDGSLVFGREWSLSVKSLGRRAITCCNYQWLNDILLLIVIFFSVYVCVLSWMSFFRTTMLLYSLVVDFLLDFEEVLSSISLVIIIILMIIMSSSCLPSHFIMIAVGWVQVLLVFHGRTRIRCHRPLYYYSRCTHHHLTFCMMRCLLWWGHRCMSTPFLLDALTRPSLHCLGINEEVDFLSSRRDVFMLHMFFRRGSFFSLTENSSTFKIILAYNQIIMYFMMKNRVESFFTEAFGFSSLESLAK